MEGRVYIVVIVDDSEFLKNWYSCSMVSRVDSIVGQNAPTAHDNCDARFRALVCQMSASSRASDIPQCSFGLATLWWVSMSFSNLWRRCTESRPSSSTTTYWRCLCSDFAQLGDLPHAFDHGDSRHFFGPIIIRVFDVWWPHITLSIKHLKSQTFGRLWQGTKLCADYMSSSGVKQGETFSAPPKDQIR